VQAGPVFADLAGAGCSLFRAAPAKPGPVSLEPFIYKRPAADDDAVGEVFDPLEHLLAF
jgi:hypothetical protein